MFVDEHVQASLHLLGFTEEDKLLKEEDVTLTFPPPGPDSELILTDQLTLLLQVHLETNRDTEGHPLLFMNDITDKGSRGTEGGRGGRRGVRDRGRRWE